MNWNPEKILAGAPNARDLGGIPAGGGKYLRTGRIIRSGPISDITAGDEAYLAGVGLRTVVDFRTEWEKYRHKDKILLGVEYIDCPLIENVADGITREMPADPDELAAMYVRSAAGIIERGGGRALMSSMYKRLASSDFSTANYRRFLSLLLANDRGALLYHCTMGKDRVGVGTAIILTALGVGRDDIVQDYMYTKARLGGNTADMLERCEKFTGDRAVLETIADMDSVNEEYMGAVFAVMDDMGGSESYLAGPMGLTPEKLEKLKAMYLE